VCQIIDSQLFTWFDAADYRYRMTIAQQHLDAPDTEESEPELRDLFLFTAGSGVFGIPADEVEGVADARRPTPLPQAPKTILGVAYARGRMLTVLDPVGMAGQATSTPPSVIKIIISLRGDEQLAFAAESVLETITISASDIELVAPPEAEPTAIAGILRHGGKTITIFDPARIFDAAVHRRDRRRRRF
jgi:chemotaxis signal transduction protein